MSCPTLKDLPPPPLGKTGWPWTEASPPLPAQMPDGSPWPRISIVTPNYNYRDYLECTIRSVLLQGYPNLEYLVIDGASKDGSVDMIRKYESFLSGWVSEKDDGQPSAINKGLSRTTGEILAYINSDDYYLPGAFGSVAQFFHDKPAVDFVNGRCRVVDEHENAIDQWFGDITTLEEVLDLWDVWWARRNYVQPECFWRRSVYERVGDFRTDLYIVFDWEYWLRMLRRGIVVERLDRELAAFRRQPAQKTGDAKSTADEELRVVRNWLWDSDVPISMSKRIKLKGKWLYDTKFRSQADVSVQRGESRLQRWAGLIALSLRYPQMLTTRLYWRRIVGSDSNMEASKA